MVGTGCGLSVTYGSESASPHRVGAFWFLFMLVSIKTYQGAPGSIQVLVLAREWRFKSSHPHHNNEIVHGGKKDAEDTLQNALRDRKRGKIGIGSQNLTIGYLLDDVLRDSVINRQSIEWAKIVINRHLRP